MKLALVDGRVTAETPPEPYAPTVLDWLRASATLRYLYYRQRVRPTVLRRMLLGRDRRYEANVDIDALRARQDKTWAATDHLFGRLAALAADRDIRLLLLMDGDRAAIYRGAAGAAAGALTLNAMVAHLAEAHGLPFIDLHPRFLAAWQESGVRFDFPSDNHWNEHGHAIAARAIEDHLRNHAPLVAPATARHGSPAFGGSWALASTEEAARPAHAGRHGARPAMDRPAAAVVHPNGGAVRGVPG